MLLCLDVGNTNIFGGVFAKDEVILRFRYNTCHGSTSDQMGVFLRCLLRENNLDAKEIRAIAICSVVPSVDYSLHAACKKYFNLEPFILRSGIKTGIKIKTRNPAETGADLIAGCLAAVHDYPKDNVIVVDLGTATTLCAVSADKEFLGAVILAGLKISMDALQSNAAKLYPVEIIKPEKITGRFTTEAMQAGLYHGHLGAIKECLRGMSAEVFGAKKPIIIGTGGFAHLFEAEKIFDNIQPDLILHGLRLAFEMNGK
jgi:type III pantothenate kinase